ncbi:glycosyltransferase family 39 protein [Actinomycetota bacterium Odt1-20B]
MPGSGVRPHVLAPCALMLSLGLWGLSRGDSMWRDEAATWQAAHRSVPELWQMTAHVDVVHGLYYLFMHAVFAVFGDGLGSLRLPSVLAMSGAAGLVADLGARLAGRWVGLAAGLSFALMPAVQEYAQEGRPYALVTLFVALSCRLLVAAVDRPGPGRWTAYGATVLTAALLNWFSLLVLCAHGVTVALARPARRIVGHWSVAASAAALGALPLVAASRDQAAQIAWIPGAGAGTVVGVVVMLGAGGGCAWFAGAGARGDAALRGRAGGRAGAGARGRGRPEVQARAIAVTGGAAQAGTGAGARTGAGTGTRTIAAASTAGTAPATATIAATAATGTVPATETITTTAPADAPRADTAPADAPRADTAPAGTAPAGTTPPHPSTHPRITLPTLALPLLTLPPLLLLAASTLRPVYLARYVLFTHLGLALLIGAACHTLAIRTSTPPLRTVLAAATCAFLLLLPAQMSLRDPHGRIDDVLSAAANVATAREPGDAVLYIPAARRDTALVTPGDFVGLDDVALAQGPLESGTLNGVEAGPRHIERAMLRAHRILVVTDARGPSPGTARDRVKQRVLQEHFLLGAERSERGRKVMVWVRKSSESSDSSENSKNWGEQ